MGFRNFPYNVDYYVVGGLKRTATGEVKRKRGRPPAIVSDTLYTVRSIIAFHITAHSRKIRGTSKASSKLCEKFFGLSFFYK